MKVYISGGAKNGKSTTAQNMAVSCARENSLPLYYVATMVPTDKEDKKRISRHVKDREGLGFITVERAKNISGIINAHENSICNPKGVFLLDSITALLANAMFPQGEEFNLNAGNEVAEDLENFLSEVDNAIMVSDYIYADPRSFSRMQDSSLGSGKDYTDLYMRALAYVDRKISKLCDRILEVSAGTISELK